MKEKKRKIKHCSDKSSATRNILKNFIGGNFCLTFIVDVINKNNPRRRVSSEGNNLSGKHKSVAEIKGLHLIHRRIRNARVWMSYGNFLI